MQRTSHEIHERLSVSGYRRTERCMFALKHSMLLKEFRKLESLRNLIFIRIRSSYRTASCTESLIFEACT